MNEINLKAGQLFSYILYLPLIHRKMISKQSMTWDLLLEVMNFLFGKETTLKAITTSPPNEYHETHSYTNNFYEITSSYKRVIAHDMLFKPIKWAFPQIQVAFTKLRLAFQK